MRTISTLSICALSTAASVLLVALAQADAPALFAQGGNVTTAVHRASEVRDATAHQPELDWTARIGSGTAAQRGEADKTVHEHDSSDATAKRPSRAHWTSRIGTGAAARER